MRVEMMEPLEVAAKIKITFDGEEIFAQEFAAGETPCVDVETKKCSGRALAVMIKGGEEIKVGMASYYYDDLRGGRMLVEDARALVHGGKPTDAGKKLAAALAMFKRLDADGYDFAQLRWEQRVVDQVRNARRLLKTAGKAKSSTQYRDQVSGAIAILEEVSPDSNDLADAYLKMCWLKFNGTGFRRAKSAIRTASALEFYEKALSVYERRGDKKSLRGHLSNISVMYARVGDKTTSVQRAVRGLQLELDMPAHNDESIGAWTHAAGRYLSAGMVGHAEAVINHGLKTFGADTPNCGYLYELLARVHEARAEKCRQDAAALLASGKRRQT